MRYIEGEYRDQTVLFPESLDDYVSENNVVRFIDSFVENLDMVQLNFKYSETKVTGRKPYNPADMLRLYIYGYLNKIRSSRELEKSTHRNIELIWLMKKLKPDFKTIADFRKDNGKSLINVCKQFVHLCKDLKLFGSNLVAIDGSKFSAVNSNRRNHSKSKLKKLLNETDKQVREYLTAIDKNDDQNPEDQELTQKELHEKIEQLNEKMNKYNQLLEMIEQTGETQISLTDPDSRMMKDQQNRDVCYNGQIAVDEKNKLIVEHDVCNDGNDLNQLHNIAHKAKDTLGVDKIEAVADKGYFKKEEIKKCQGDNIDCYIPEPLKSQNKHKGLFTNKDFKYIQDRDIYICPAGSQLHYSNTITKSAKQQKRYQSKACRCCEISDKCTSDKWGRKIYRWEHESIIEEMSQRMEVNPGMMDKRKALVEHPFGTLKRTMNHGYFLTKGLDNVRAEFSLSILAYNIKRVLNIVDFKQLMAQIAIIIEYLNSISSKKLNIKRNYKDNKVILRTFYQMFNFLGIQKKLNFA